jgi:hypothetical protein
MTPDALPELLDGYGDQVFSYCWRLLRNRENAQIAMRDALVAATAQIRIRLHQLVPGGRRQLGGPIGQPGRPGRLDALPSKALAAVPLSLGLEQPFPVRLALLLPGRRPLPLLTSVPPVSLRPLPSHIHGGPNQ